MTTGQKLAAVIRAQVAGGFDAFGFTLADDGLAFAMHGAVMSDNYFHVLEILLDPQGLRAVWTDDGVDIPNGYDATCSEAEAVAIQIVQSWLSSDGDAAKTIDKAYGLLPTTNVSTPPTENEER